LPLVVLFFRDNTPYFTSRVACVAPVSGDHVDMHVRNGLSRGIPDVHPHVAPVGVILLLEPGPALPEQVVQGSRFRGSVLEIVRKMPGRYYQDVAGCHREPVEYGVTERSGDQYLLPVGIAEGQLSGIGQLVFYPKDSTPDKSGPGHREHSCHDNCIPSVGIGSCFITGGCTLRKCRKGVG
jgi:hypothetical protein